MQRVHIQVFYQPGLAATCRRSQKAGELVMSLYLYIFIDHTHYNKHVDVAIGEWAHF